MKKYESFEEWQDTGRFIPRDFYERENPNVMLRDDCTDVVFYGDGSYIQGLISNMFYVNEQNKSMVLDDVEMGIWNEIKMKVGK